MQLVENILALSSALRDAELIVQPHSWDHCVAVDLRRDTVQHGLLEGRQAMVEKFGHQPVPLSNPLAIWTRDGAVGHR